MNIELKPCPFCGGEAEVRVSPNSRSEEGASFYEVRCKICGVHVTGEAFNFWVVKYNEEKPQDLLSAVEVWNKRAYDDKERKKQVTPKDIEIWLNKWDGYIDKDIIARMCYRICDIFKIAQKRAEQEVKE